MMRWLKVSSVGTAIWSVGLIWPEINRFLTVQMMLVTVLGLATLMLAYLLFGPRDEALASLSSGETSPRLPRRPKSLSDTHPMKPLGMA